MEDLIKQARNKRFEIIFPNFRPILSGSMLIFHVFYNTNNTKSLKATFPYWENCRIPSFHRTPDLGNFISAQRAGNGLASESLHGVKQNAKKNWCVCRGLGWDWELNFRPSLLAFLGMHTSKIAHLRRTCAHRRHRIHHTYPEIIALQNGHRIPYGGESDFTFFPPRQFFSLFFFFS